MDLYTSQHKDLIQIDEDDLPKLEGFSLTTHRDRKSRYGTRYGMAIRKENGKWRYYNLGRLLLGLEKGDKREAEHVDPERPLDYRRSNLRIATRAQNNANRRMRKDNTSGYKGVSKNPDKRGGWKAQIMVDGKAIVLGVWPTKEEAFEDYCQAAKQYHGEFARPERRVDGPDT